MGEEGVACTWERDTRMRKGANRVICPLCGQSITRRKAKRHASVCTPESAAEFRAKRLAAQQRVRAAGSGTVPRTDAEWAALFPRYPVDDEGFAKSFAADDPEGYLPLLRDLGVCVVRVLSRERCEETVRAMFEDLNAVQRPGATVSLDPNDPTTWGAENWPAASGKFLTAAPTLCRVAFENRVSDAVFTAFKHMYGHEDLMCTMDVWGVARGSSGLPPAVASVGQGPSRGTVGADGLVDRPDWRWHLPLHWHVDPWTHTAQHADKQRTLMSLVALRDMDMSTGGHVTVPGSTAFMDVWAAENAARARARVPPTFYVPSKDPVQRYSQRLCLRAGDLVVWDRRQMHGSFENRGPKPRLYQFIRYTPKGEFYSHYDKFSPPACYRRYDLWAAALCAAARHEDEAASAPASASAVAGGGGDGDASSGVGAGAGAGAGVAIDAAMRRVHSVPHDSRYVGVYHMVTSLRGKPPTTSPAGHFVPLQPDGVSPVPLHQLIAQQHRDVLDMHDGRGWKLMCMDRKQ